MRYYVQDFGPTTKIVKDHKGELPEQEFDNTEDANALCDFLNTQHIEKLNANKKYNNLKYRIKKVMEAF